MLRVEKLNKYYRVKGHKPLHVIDNTTIEIPETGVIAVVGASGAGKTTLINTISGLDSFKNGKITFDDVSMKHYNNHIADKLRLQNYGFIFQNYYLLEKQTVYENVKVALDGFDISESEKKKRVVYVLNQLGIAKYTNKVVTSLSGGEQQRVSIARALVKSPRIIFADEPTGSLDEKTTFTVLNILKKVSQNCAVFIVTHEREIISYYADYIIELDKGVVVKEFVPSKKEDKSLAIDQNIYLKELNHLPANKEENISFDIYSDGSSIEESAVKVAIRNGKVYLEASENIQVLTKESENHLIEDDRYQIKDYVDDNFDYSLERVPYSNNKIGISEVFKKSFKNLRMKKPIKYILKAVCAFLAMILLIIVEGIGTIRSLNLSDSLTSSRGNLYLTILPNSDDMDNTKLANAYKSVTEEVDNSNLNANALFVARDTLSFTYNGFYQIQQKQYPLPLHDFREIDYLDSSSLIFGHMPNNGYEIVVDEYLLENFLNKSHLDTVITDYGYFIGKSFTSSYNKYDLVVSGVCRTKSPTIYGHKSINFFRIARNVALKPIDLDYAKTLYPSLKDITIEKGHYLRNINYGDVTFDALKVDSYFEDIPYDIIINPEDYLTIKYRPCANRHDLYISTDGDENTIQQVKELIERTKNNLKEDGIGVEITINNRYQNEYDAAVEDSQNILTSTEIMGIVLGAVALLLIVLSTYLSMLNQISDIAVYRSLGYSRFFLGMTYFVELLMLAFIYCLIGGGLTFLTMFLLDAIPLVEFILVTPFIYFLVLPILLAVLISLIGVIPIMMVFRLTPASIYNRYNRRITGE